MEYLQRRRINLLTKISSNPIQHYANFRMEFKKKLKAPTKIQKEPLNQRRKITLTIEIPLPVEYREKAKQTFEPEEKLI